jgi:transcription elongation factor S-II
MRQIENSEEFRKNMSDKLDILIEDVNITTNLEKGIYNYSLEFANQRNIVKKWDNHYFVQIYLDRFKTIYINLKNPDLMKKLKNKEFKAHELAFMTHQNMVPEKWESLIEEKRIRDKNKFQPVLEASSDDFTCRKCKSKKCSYYQLQTRSADEPMTTFVSCLDCGNRWKC